MDHHNHFHRRAAEHDTIGVRKRRIGAFLLNFFFTIIEYIAGALTNAMAMLAVAVHDRGDTIAISSALLFEKKAEKPRDRKYTYGYTRYSTLGALLTSCILVI